MKYQAPMMVEIGDAEQLTYWQPWALWDDGVGGWVWIPGSDLPLPRPESFRPRPASEHRLATKNLSEPKP